MSVQPTPLLSAPLAPASAKPRERILAAAYDLFARRGIRAVGIDAIIEQSGVARMTLYRHFASKDDLVLAFLERRETLWTTAWLQAEVEHRAQQPIDQLLAIFDVLSDWFRLDSFEGCSFVNVMLETTDRGSAIRRASVLYLERSRAFVEALAARAGIVDTAGFARKWHLLVKGAIVAAAEGDADAGQRARQIGTLVLVAALAIPPASD
ncbi:MAG TPA: helix-turn-helix domain-containing protein [Gammaproteobacteria bacterium]|nr:helix-turn-helix domain-containing protein [Gammaproteobacteria bacterium]